MNYNLPREPVHDLVVESPDPLDDSAPDTSLQVHKGAQDGQDNPKKLQNIVKKEHLYHWKNRYT